MNAISEGNGEFEVFPWNDNFATGLPLIDEQHEKLIELLNQLASHLVRDDVIELERVFSELAAYADYHFKEEEKIWRPYFKDDSWFERHLQTHNSFLPKVLELKAEENTKPYKEVVEDIIKFLIHWLAYHILDNDKRMAIVLFSVDEGLSLDQAKKRSEEEMSGSVKVLIDTVLTMYDSLSTRTLDLMREQIERERAEAALREAHDTLEQKVEERTAELELEIVERKRTEKELSKAKADAEAANRAKTEFLANMSHELRTPLNAIIGFSEIIKDAMFGPLEGKYRNYGLDIHASGSHLLGVISDILDIAILEAGRLKIETSETDLREIVGVCKTIVQARAIAAGVQLKFDLDDDIPLIYADPLRLKQILINLLTNSVKFTPKGGSVTVHSERITNGGVRLSVTDTGIGIAEDDIPKALEKFGQVREGYTHAHEGAGLGLALSKSMMELHGGSLKINSEIGVATTVLLDFPPTPAA
jgi:hemerythrin-like metal-binding protein